MSRRELWNQSEWCLAATPWYESARADARGATIAVVVRFAACLACQPLDVEAWRAHVDELKQVLPKANRDDPRLVFDLHEVDLGGRRGIALYKLSVVDEGRSVVHGMTVWWHDGRDEIVLDVTARGGSAAPPASAEDAEARATRADLARAAAAVFDAFAPAFGR